MNAVGVVSGLFNVSERSIEAKQRHSDRIHFSVEPDPNDIGGAAKAIRTAHADHDLDQNAAVTSFPHPPNVPFREQVWQPFLSGNARRVFKL
jgi:hypothetical protein